MNSENIYLSIITALRNEAENLQELHDRLNKACQKLGKSYEIIYVENGSRDDSMKVLKSLEGARIISLRIPVGSRKTAQSAALDAGIKHSKGKIIVTLDADLQNPPEEIPNLLDKLEKDQLDVVSGWRKRRKDSFVIRSLSKFGSFLREKIINPGVHDLGCTLKAYRRECFDGLDLYGEMHRYTVAILKWRGFKVGEIEVEHVGRVAGDSKYNWQKAFRGFVDMWQIWFTKKYDDRPLHLFGVSGVFFTIAGFAMLAMLGILRLMHLISLSQSIWPLIAILLIIVGVQFFIFGMIMDMMIRNYYASSGQKSYLIKEIVEV